MPLAVPAGIVTGAEPVLDPPAASAGTARVPTRMSPASNTALVDRYRFVVDAADGPAPWFMVTSVTMKVAPAPETSGPTTDVTTRSGGTSSLTIVTAALVGHPPRYDGS